MHTPEENNAILDHWEHLRRPTEQIAIEAVAPRPVVITWKPDETQVAIISYRFDTFENIQSISFLEIIREAPEHESIKKMFPGGFNAQLGEFLANNQIFDRLNPEFEKDVAVIAENCAVTVRNPRKAEYVHKMAELTIDIDGVKKKNKETWSRFNDTGKESTTYLKKCDLPRDIQIPGLNNQL